MLKFNEEWWFESFKGALAKRQEIEKIVDRIAEEGYDNIFFLGIGGTYASSMQVVQHIKEFSALPAFVEHAAEYMTTGNKALTKNSVVVFSSVSGTTEEVLVALKHIRENVGARVIGFIDKENTPMGELADHLVIYPMNEQLKFFMLADRFMWHRGDFGDYEALYKELDAHLPAVLVDVEKRADEFGRAFAEKHHQDDMHYFVGAGNQMGATYSYAMCYWEEQHWIRTKSIHAAEFLHGTLEIIDRDTNVTLFLGEDSQRPLAERVKAFLPRICGNCTFIDTRDYPLEGISQGFRGHISHLVMMAVNRRIDAHLEKINCHPVEIRRYYRQLKY